MSKSSKFLICSVLLLTSIPLFSTHQECMEDNEITAAHVFQMIEPHGFYCEISKNSSFQGEGLNNIDIPSDFIFHSERVVTSKLEEDLINTNSHRPDNPLQNDTINLWWSPQIKECSYEGALLHLRILNNKKISQSSQWRLPTLMELMSIVTENQEHIFPAEFKLPPKKEIMLWTSTPVKKEGTVLEYDRDRQAYFVLLYSFSAETGKYSISFNFKNIDDKRLTGFLIPILADKTTTYQPPDVLPPDPAPDSSEDILEFDEPNAPNQNTPAKSPLLAPFTPIASNISPDKIPGLDDVPIAPPPANPVTTSTIPSQIKIALFPFKSKREIASSQEKELLEEVSNEIINTLNGMTLECDQGTPITISISQPAPTQIEKIYQFHAILNNSTSTESEKIGRIKEIILTPDSLDLLVTIYYTIETDTIETIHSVIFDGRNNSITEKKMIQNTGTKRFDSLKEYIVTEIGGIILDYYNLKE